ncbi:MAG: signal peptidase II [Bacteroidota bacterium]
MNEIQTSEKKSKTYLFFILAITLIIADQITKLSVKGFDIFGLHHQGMGLGESISVIGTFLQWTYVENSGMAFGITFGAGKIFLSLFSIIAGTALGYYLCKLDKFSVWVRLGVALIFAGALGNLIDRVFYGVIFNEGPLFYGRVVDFIQFDIPDINLGFIYYTHFPVFNIADSCVTCGVALLLLFHKRIPTFDEVFRKDKFLNKSGAENLSLNESEIQKTEDEIQSQ